MSSQQTRTPSDRSPAGAEPETHWSEDTDFQWRAATELLIGVEPPVVRRETGQAVAGAQGWECWQAARAQRLKTMCENAGD